MAAVSFTRDIPTRSLLAGNVGHLTAFEHIQSITVGSLGASSVTFSEIPQDYRHLQIRILARNTSTDNSLNMRINGDSGSNYSYHGLWGNGSSAGSNGSTSQNLVPAGQTTTSVNSNMFACSVVDILDYSSTVKNKTVRSLNGWDGNGSGAVQLLSGLRMSTESVMSLTFLFTTAGLIAQYSTFSLYGIR